MKAHLIPARLRARLEHWWWQRLPRRAQITLQQRNLYIVPSRAGWAFAVTLLLLLLASINYQLNLGYALTFLLAGSALASMHITHSNLRGLSLHLRTPAPAFAGTPALLEIRIDNPGRPRHGIGLGIAQAGRATDLTWVDVAAQNQSTVSLGWLPTHRGCLDLPVLRIETRFPFGLFRTWSLWRPDAQLWVYPRPEQHPPPLPVNESAGELRPQGLASPSVEFEGVRPWRRGDSLHHIVWKKLARSDELISRDNPPAGHPHLWLDWNQTNGMDTESRLSRLTAWVLEVRHREMPFGLRLPHVELGMAEGHSHQEEALRRLATWKEQQP
jgi:uncharacterized protein (DUF58 family)